MRELRAIALDRNSLQPGRFAGDHAHSAIWDPQRPGQQRHNRRIGLALVGHGLHPHTKYGAAVVALLDSLDRITAGVRGNAQVERQPAWIGAVGQRRGDR